jgi:photosystem II stability/assembly factor-like uncharacterized protein
MKKIYLIIAAVFVIICANAQSGWWRIISEFPQSYQLYDIHFIDNHTGWVVGYNYGGDGVCFKTNDGGYSWSSLNIGVTDHLLSVEFYDELIGYAAGENGKLIKTIDGGQNWTSIPTGLNESICVDVIFDPNKIMISTFVYPPYIPDTFISKISDDGGQTWNLININSNLFRLIQNIQFIDEFVGYIAAVDTGYTSERDSLHIYKTNNGGYNWSLVSSTYGEFVNANCYFVNQNIGYCAGRSFNDYIQTYKTIDGGLNWSALTSGDGFYFYFHNEYFGWNWQGLYSDGTIKKTIDGGTTFATTYFSEYDIQGLCFINSPGPMGWGFDGHESGIIHFEPLQYESIDFNSNVIPNQTNIYNIIAPGKIVRFKTEIRNQVGINLMTLSGDISTTNPYVTILNGTGVFNNIQAGETGWNINEFEIQLAENIPDNEVVMFDMVLEDQIVNSGPWVTSFSFPLVLNPFEVSNNIIDDDNIPDSDGNNNDIAEPGESIEIIPLMDNTTAHNFVNIEGYLISTYPQIHIWNDTMGDSEVIYNHYTYGNLNAGASNVTPEKDFVFTNKFAEIYTLPFSMIMKGFISSFNGSDRYENIEFRWGADFMMNEGYPNPPNGIDENDAGNTISIFPNPANKKIIITKKGELHEDAIVSIFEMNGQDVMQQKFQNQKPLEMDVSALTKGIYLVKIQTKEVMEFKKLVIQ